MKDTFMYRNTIKHGSPQEIREAVKQLVKKEMEQGRRTKDAACYDCKAE